jgi:hypothetical protein
VSIGTGLDRLVVKRIGIGDTAFLGCIRYHSIAWFRRGAYFGNSPSLFSGWMDILAFFCYLLG